MHELTTVECYNKVKNTKQGKYNMKITSEVVKVRTSIVFNAIHKGVPFASIDMSSMTKEAWEIVKDPYQH